MHGRKVIDIYYREAGVASWSMEDKRSVALAMWQQALSISGYVLEYQLAIVSRVHERVVPIKVIMLIKVTIHSA